jgi:phosphoribosyl 1,2-cyclic phosphodiesterase
MFHFSQGKTMALKFSFLGSGSRGNCTLVESDQWKFLIDLGFSLRQTSETLRYCQTGIENLSAAIITHTHDDHIKKSTVKRLASSNVTLFCRNEHESRIGNWEGFKLLREKHLVRPYADNSFEMLPGVTVQPIAVSHDSPATHGFVFDFKTGNSQFRFVYAADCGFPSTDAISKFIPDADLVALEFNHDEEMERRSGRPWFLINRVLGPQGHLSNRSAANLLGKTKSKKLRGVVQLHLSRDCNRPDLAMTEAQNTLGSLPVHQTAQDTIGPIINIA